MSTFLTGDRINATLHGGGWQPGAILEVHAVNGLVRVALEDGREVWLSTIHVRKAATASSPAVQAARETPIVSGSTPASGSAAATGAGAASSS